MGGSEDILRTKGVSCKYTVWRPEVVFPKLYKRQIMLSWLLQRAIKPGMISCTV